MRTALLTAAATLVSAVALAQSGPTGSLNTQTLVHEDDRGQVFAVDADGGQIFADWTEYIGSQFFVKNDMRCAADKLFMPNIQHVATSDCSSSFTSNLPQYDPQGGASYVIPVVVHVLQRKNNVGNISDALINSQIDVLNEDFQAFGGGANGTDVNISFTLAGVTRSKNNSWYNDSGTYYNSLAWDTTRYLNIYTNTAGGNLGYAYVPSSGGVVGNTWDRVVIYWRAFGDGAPIGPPYNLGRTVTHEVGHYLGLYHTFDGGCASASGCASNGDLICDTNPESSPMGSGACSRTTCSSPDPVDNYMDYSDDICMQRFTPIQANRMRCTLENFRVDLGQGGTGGNPPGKATGPSPSNGATGVSTSATLSWTAGTGATSGDVFFGTDPTPDAGESQGNQAGTTFDPGSLVASTTYYWRVDAVNDDGTTTGDVWSFTTAGGGGPGISLSANGYKVKGKWTADLSWSGAAGGSVDIYRDGSFLISTANDGAYTDATTFKGGGSMTYQVCETDGGACSNMATVNF